ncbi:protein translocase subunit SecE [Mycolicibacterium murale]|uniref:Protein translocase subunit SecE n=1 Tax=Mycolicibacterium murale TaxID=182220 RepID=A0A7I9WUJ8_9MYCO|nr:preprotein translocase subunit SecE [Mycolicibacterium murale]MCV7185722.1 preprotein translocase subunit SecE [Mycolicibacterium murale]GFG61415.1 protein translocase subunit SecE [Mycolicibacterium murale]
MSDERDNADATDGTTDQNTGDQGRSLATGTVTPQRPTGKRSRQRALAGGGTDDAEPSTDVETEANTNGSGKTPKAKTAKDSSGPSRNPILYVINYLKQVVAELRKVIWPNRKQMVTYTSVVLVFLAFMVALISGVDLGLARLISLVFG